MSATISPTAERLAKTKAWLKPENDTRTRREYHRVLSLFDRLYQGHKISGEQFQASQRWEQHWNGSRGADVRMDDAGTSDADPSRRQPAIIHHGTQLADAYHRLSRNQGRALDLVCEGVETLPEIGQRIYGYANRSQATGAASVLITEALEALAMHWGYLTRSRPPSR